MVGCVVSGRSVRSGGSGRRQSTTLAGPNSHRTDTTPQDLLALILQLAHQRGGAFGRSRPYGVNERSADDQWGFEGAGQPLQPACRIDSIANHRERHAVLAADIAKDRRPVIEADADGERRVA